MDDVKKKVNRKKGRKEGRQVGLARVTMSDGSTLDLPNDGRVNLTSSEPGCIAVIPSLGSSRMAGSTEFQAVSDSCTR